MVSSAPDWKPPQTQIVRAVERSFIPLWLTQVGSLAGLATLVFTVVERIFSGRPRLLLSGTVFHRYTTCANRSSEEIYIRSLKTYPGGAQIAKGDSIDNIVRGHSQKIVCRDVRSEQRTTFPARFYRRVTTGGGRRALGPICGCHVLAKVESNVASPGASAPLYLRKKCSTPASSLTITHERTAVGIHDATQLVSSYLWRHSATDGNPAGKKIHR